MRGSFRLVGNSHQLERTVESSLGTSESQPLMHDGSCSIAREFDDNEHLPITTVEIFSDLVVAVAISSLSSSLENPDIFDWLWFWLRVYFVWSLWRSCLVLNHAVDLYGRDVRRVEFWIQMHVFGFVFVLVGLVQSSLQGNNIVSFAIYIFARVTFLVLGRFEFAAKPRRPSVISQTRYDTFMHVWYLLHILITLECLPLIIALIFYRDTQFGILIGGYVSGVILSASRLIFAQRIDLNPSYDHAELQVVDLNHVRERYEVIALVFFGGLCFVNAAGFYGYYISMCFVVTAMGAFSMYFVARVRGRTEPWVVSAEAAMHYAHLHIVLFIVLPSMGVTFSHIIEDLSEANIVRSIDPQVLLCAYSGTFLLVMGFMKLLTEDPIGEHSRPRVSRIYRVLMYFASGMALIVCGLLPIKMASQTLVSIVFTVTAAIQIWAVRHD